MIAEETFHKPATHSSCQLCGKFLPLQESKEFINKNINSTYPS